MTNLDKKNAIYIEGVVIANGVKDGYGDVLNKEDINKLMTNFMDKSVDTEHSFLEEHGVSIIKNYTTEKVKTIHGREVPIGSWVSDLMIWNEDIIRDINEHGFNGLSLASVPNKIEDIKTFFGQSAPNYRDFLDKDDLTPLMISLVEEAGNGYEFDVYPYDVYIKRNKETEKETMADGNQETSMAELAKEMLSIISRSAETTPTINAQGYEKKFREIDEKIDEKFGGLDKTIDAKLDEKLEVFLSKLESKTVEGDPKKVEGEGGDKDPKTVEGDPADDGDKEPKKDDGKKSKKGKGKKEPAITRSAPQTEGLENHTGTFTNETFECEAPRTKRDMFGRPIRN